VRLREAIVAKFPKARFSTYTSASDSNAREGARIAFKQPLGTTCEYERAQVILALDSDFLQTETGSIRAGRLFANGRRLRSANDVMSRLYVVEPTLTTTGANADHRLRLPAQDVEGYVRALARELSVRPGVEFGPLRTAIVGEKPAAVPAKWIKVVADELVVHRGHGIVVVGSRQPPRVHALVHAINEVLGNTGRTIFHPPAADPAEGDHLADLKALVADIGAGRVETLLIADANPVYDAPSDLRFAEQLAKVPTTIHLSDRFDETSRKCVWHLPAAHELEVWGDQKSVEGVIAIQQPLISPLHGGRSAIEILGFIAEKSLKSGHELVRTTHQGTMPLLAFETQWNRALRRGVIGNPIPPAQPPPVSGPDIAAAFASVAVPAPLGPDNLEVTFSPCPKMLDGRHANNPWLLELPDPLTKIVWDNAAYFSPATAKQMNVESGDVVQISANGASPIEVPVWVLPGQADSTIALALGWGRKEIGRYGSDVGFDVTPLRTTKNFWFASGVRVTPTGRKHDLVQTQEHHRMEGRPIAIDATLDEYRKTPNFAQFRSPSPRTLPLWDRVDYSKGHKWGMAIDLTACTGCNACVIACQAENNISVVGKEQVSRGRELNWLRVDRYFVGDENDPRVAVQPLMCVQCEEAPCENVCPVNATAHSPEGLNDMAYNRCIGTRYCANNCPYKVRRFNYLEFAGSPMYGDLPETRKMQFNPNVTVRMRGVMEKCTYCVQRIQEGKIRSKRDGGRPIRDGEILTACAQTCPADAIVFGDLNDPNSRVAHLHTRDRNYELLSELGTHPRTHYLGNIRNPNSEMLG
jgi:Fe-S-cluster-containing dehydrogenase component